MPAYQFYSKKSVSATETTFFDESRAEASNGMNDTNMERAYKFFNDFSVDKIIVALPFEEVQAAAASTGTQLDDHKILVDEAVIALQIGDEDVKYFRVSECLDNISAVGEAELAQGTAADDQYQLASLVVGDGEKGLPVDFTIPADTEIDVTLNTVSSPTSINAVIILDGTEAA